MDAADSILENAALTNFSPKFFEEGYDNLEFLMKLDEERLKKILEVDIGMKKGHIMRFLEALNECRLSSTNKNTISITDKSTPDSKATYANYIYSLILVCYFDKSFHLTNVILVKHKWCIWHKIKLVYMTEKTWTSMQKYRFHFPTPYLLGPNSFWQERILADIFLCFKSQLNRVHTIQNWHSKIWSFR